MSSTQYPNRIALTAYSKRAGWRKASGGEVSHADIWRQIDGWIQKFVSSEFDDGGKRTVRFVHVRAHTGIAGNERADELAGKGSKLRHTLMVNSQPRGWFRKVVVMTLFRLKIRINPNFQANLKIHY